MRHCNYSFNIIIFGFSLLFICCSGKESSTLNNNLPFDYVLVPQDTVEIMIDMNTKPFHFLTEICYLNLKECLYFNESNRVDFYGLESKKLEKRIVIPVDGPNGVGLLEYIKYISPDTIFVKGKSPFKVYHFNDKGQKLGTFDLTGNKYIASRGFYANNNAPMLYSNNRLILYVGPAVNPTQWFFDQPLIFTYNRIDSSITNLPFRFPRVFDEKDKEWIFVDFNPGITINENNLLISYPFLDSLYVYSFLNRKLNTFAIKSVFQNRKNEAQPKSASVESYYKSYQNITAYYFIKYDKYRDVYYRLVLHPVEMETNNKLIALNEIMEQKPLSIQIISNKFDLIGEINLMESKYGIDDFFIGEKGLYLSNNNSKNENFDENKLSYTLFVLHDKHK